MDAPAVLQDQPENVDLTALLARLVPTGCQVTVFRRQVLECLVLPDRKEILECPVLQESQVHRENPVVVWCAEPEFLDRQDHQDLLVCLDRQGQMAALKVNRNKDHLACPDHLEEMAYREWTACPVRMAQWVLRAEMASTVLVPKGTPIHPEAQR